MDRQAYVIVGGGGGIGAATARILTEKGARVFLTGRTEESLAAIGRELDVPFAVADAGDFEETERIVTRAVEEFGRLDGIANLAGSLILKPAHLTTSEEFEATLHANLRTAFAVVRAGATALRAKGGSIVLASTAAARIGLANHEAIAAAKGGVEGLVLAAAATYAGRGIRVNAVAPGLTRTPLAAPITSNDAAAKKSAEMHALGRLGEPEDVASAVAWLLDPAQSWVTGQVIGIDGGLSRVRSRRG